MEEYLQHVYVKNKKPTLQVIESLNYVPLCVYLHEHAWKFSGKIHCYWWLLLGQWVFRAGNVVNSSIYNPIYKLFIKVFVC